MEMASYGFQRYFILVVFVDILYGMTDDLGAPGIGARCDGLGNIADEVFGQDRQLVKAHGLVQRVHVIIIGFRLFLGQAGPFRGQPRQNGADAQHLGLDGGQITRFDHGNLPHEIFEDPQALLAVSLLDPLEKPVFQIVGIGHGFVFPFILLQILADVPLFLVLAVDAGIIPVGRNGREDAAPEQVRQMGDILWFKCPDISQEQNGLCKSVKMDVVQRENVGDIAFLQVSHDERARHKAAEDFAVDDQRDRNFDQSRLAQKNIGLPQLSGKLCRGCYISGAGALGIPVGIEIIAEFVLSIAFPFDFSAGVEEGHGHAGYGAE